MVCVGVKHHVYLLTGSVCVGVAGGGGGGRRRDEIGPPANTRVGVLYRLDTGATQSCNRDELMTAWQEDGVGWGVGGGGGR